jgi:hypothetical protein
VAEDFAARTGSRLDFSVAQDARKNPNVCWHLRDRLFAPGCIEDRHCDPGRPAVRFPVVQEQLSDVEVSVAKTDLKTAQRSLRHANPQVPLDRYARSVTNEMVASLGRFLEKCGMGVERKVLPQSATDRIQNVGA